MTPGERSTAVAGGAVVVGLYVLLAWSGQVLGQFDTLSVWYAPAGLALAVGVLAGWRALPFLFLGELLGGIIIFQIAEFFSPLQMVLNAAAYAAWYVLASLPLRQGRAALRPIHRRQPIQRWILAVVLGPSAAAVTGIAMQVWAGMLPMSDFWPAVAIWWVGDAIGVVTLTPPLLIIALLIGVGGRRVVPEVLQTDQPLRILGLLLLPALGTALALLVSGGNPAALAVVLVFVAPLAARFGTPGFALITISLSPTVTLAGNAVASRTAALDRTGLQILLLSLLAMGYLVGLVADQQRRALRRTRELAEIIEGTSDIVATADRHGRLVHLNPSARRLAGLGPDEPLDELDERGLYTTAVSGQLLTEARSAALEQGRWHGELMLQDAEGEQHPVSCDILAHHGTEAGPTRTTAIMRDLRDQRRLETELRRRSTIDELTGLTNRAIFTSQVELLCRRLRETDSVGTVLVLRLHRFDVLTHGLGASQGDDVLRQIAHRLQQACGGAVLPGRLDGTAFGLLPQAPLSRIDAVILARGLIDAVAGPVRVGDREIPMIVGIGVAEINATTTDVGTLIAGADVAAHRACAAGPGNVMCHEESMSVRARAELQREEQLLTAVASGSWQLYHQPIARTDTLEIVAVEALLRFRPDESPYQLIVLAEELGVMPVLGAAILETAVEQLAALTHPGLRMNVNASITQLCEPGFADLVGQQLDRHGVDPARLAVEVTESAASEGDGAVRRTLDALHDLGVAIALDDFGAGHSSLSLLHELPIDVLKLDRSFTAPLTSSARARSLVGTTIAMARSLGMDVVAEGVEEEAQREVLLELDCPSIQGYLLARPAPLDRLSLNPLPTGGLSSQPAAVPEGGSG